MRWTFSVSFTAALVAIILGTGAAVLTAAFPGSPIVSAIVGGITAVATLVRIEYGAPAPPTDGAG